MRYVGYPKHAPSTPLYPLYTVYSLYPSLPHIHHMPSHPGEMMIDHAATKRVTSSEGAEIRNTEEFCEGIQSLVAKAEEEVY